MRTEFVIDIPVEEGDNVVSFTQRYGQKDEEFWEVSKQLFEFIMDNLPKFGVSDIALRHEYFVELIRNSYDAYVHYGLRRGERLQIKIVITAPVDGKNEVTIKVKDNGKGFSAQPKSSYFDRSKVQRDEKPHGAFGWSGQGLRNFETNVNSQGGTVVFKNRKANGGAVYIKFKRNRPAHPTEISRPTHIKLRSSGRNNKSPLTFFPQELSREEAISAAEQAGREEKVEASEHWSAATIEKKW